MNLPKTPEEAAAIVNNNIIPPLVKVILAFVDGNENMKKSQETVDGMLLGFTGAVDAINNNNAIVTPIIKEGFAAEGLNIDKITTAVTSSIAYNYVGSPDNITNDLFVNIPFVNYDPTAVKNIEVGSKTEMTDLYNVNGMKVHSIGAHGVYIKRMSDGTSRKVVVK